MGQPTEGQPAAAAGEGQPAGEAGDGFTPITSQEQLNATIADRLRRQSAQYGGTPAEVKAKLDQLAQFEQAQKTAEQRAADTVAAAEKKAAEAQTALRSKTAENALLTAAAGKLRVPSDAVLHLAGQVEFDDDGNVTSDVAALVDGLLKGRPDLAGAQTRVPAPNPGQGTSGNGTGAPDPRAQFASLFTSQLSGS